MNKAVYNYIVENFPEDVETVHRYFDIVFRVKTLEKIAKELGNLTEDPEGIFSYFGKDGLSDDEKDIILSCIVIQNWIGEVQKELDELTPKISNIVNKVNTRSWIEAIGNILFNEDKREELSGRMAQEFLNAKWGKEDSPSKDSMKSICQEAMLYLFNSAEVMRDTFEALGNKEVEGES